MWRRSRIYLLTAVVVLVVVVAGILLYLTLDPSAQTSIHAEAIKVILQLVALGVVGGFVTGTLTERSKEQDRKHMQRQQAAAHQETLNDFRRSAVARLVTTTNDVRKAPLLIDAHRSKKTYGEQLRAILDAQLELSLLRHEYDSGAVFTKWPMIRDEIGNMEQYLRQLTDEWRQHYQKIPPPPNDAWDALKQLPKLGDLRQGDETTSFQRIYIHAYQEAIRLMREEILQPVDNPAAMVGEVRA